MDRFLYLVMQRLLQFHPAQQQPQCQCLGCQNQTPNRSCQVHSHTGPRCLQICRGTLVVISCFRQNLGQRTFSVNHCLASDKDLWIHLALKNMPCSLSSHSTICFYMLCATKGLDGKARWSGCQKWGAWVEGHTSRKQLLKHNYHKDEEPGRDLPSSERLRWTCLLHQRIMCHVSNASMFVLTFSFLNTT
jgi:hypothetical protein